MPKYKYTARNLAGEETSGERESPDVDGLVDSLRGQGYYPVKIAEINERNSFSKRHFIRRVSLKAMALFCNQLATVLAAGVPLAQALDLLVEQTEDKRLRAILADVIVKIRGGKSLSDAFRPHTYRLPPLFLNMLEAGELSGTLDSCLSRAGDTFSRSHRLQSKVKEALVYPKVLMVLTLVVIVFLLTFVVPQFVSVFQESGSALPAITQLLMSVSGFATQNILLLIVAAALLFLGWKGLQNADRPKTLIDQTLIGLPKIGVLWTRVLAARYTRTFATMIAAGVPITSALEVTSRSVGNRYLEKRIAEMVEEVRLGIPVSTLLAKMGKLPPMITHMTRLGEESGMTETLMEQAAGFYETESESAVGRLVGLLEPAILIVMGGMVLFVVLSIITPMFGMYSSVGQM